MSPQNNRFEGGKGSVQVALPLGVGAVSTQTKVVASVPKNCVVKAIRFYGQGAVTGTSITAEVFARTSAGAAGNTLQSAATSVAFATAAAGKTGVAASLTATAANLRLNEDRLLEVVVTATSITVGPGDLLVAIEFEPRI